MEAILSLRRFLKRKVLAGTKIGSHGVKEIYHWIPMSIPFSRITLTEEALKFRGNIGPSRFNVWLEAEESSSPLHKSAFASKVLFLWRTWRKQPILMVNTMQELLGWNLWKARNVMIIPCIGVWFQIRDYQVAGGIIRDYQGKIKLVFYRYLGEWKNNMAENNMAWVVQG